MPKTCQGAKPLLPRPSAATRQPRTVIAMQTRASTFGRLASWPFALARSMNVTETASIREMAEEMAAISTRM